VDSQTVERRTDDGVAARLLDVSSARLYVGGVGVSGRTAAVDAGLDSLHDVNSDRHHLAVSAAAAGSLRGGCIRNFKVHTITAWWRRGKHSVSFATRRTFLTG